MVSWRELFRRVDQQYYLSEYVHYNIEELSIISIIGVCPLQYQRVVHNINYQSMSTTISEGCLQCQVSEYVHHNIGGLSTQLFIGGLSTQLFIGVYPLIYISEGCPQIKQTFLF